MGTNMAAHKRYGVVTTWNDDCTVRIGSHIEEMPDGIYRLASDELEAERDIKALEKEVGTWREFTRRCSELRDEQVKTIERLREELHDARNLQLLNSMTDAALKEGQ